MRRCRAIAGTRRTRIAGRPEPPAKENTSSGWARAMPGFFETIGAKMAMGRPFTEDDTATTRPVAVINEAFARRFFKNENPLGKHFGPDKIQYASKYEIVGVVKDMRYMTYDYKDPIGPMYWISEAQTTHWDDPVFEAGEIWSHYLYNIVIWAPGNPPGIEEKVRKALASVDPDLVLYGVDSYDKVVRGDFQQEDMIATLTTLVRCAGTGAFGGWPVRRDGLHGGAAHGGDRRPHGAGRRSRKCLAHGAKGRLFPGGHRIGDRHSRRDRRRQADDAAIVQRKTLGSGHAGLGHVGVGTGSVARVGAARMARRGRGTHGGAAQRMRDSSLVLWMCGDPCEEPGQAPFDTWIEANP